MSDSIKNSKKGFSLIELLVAMAIIAVLISIAAYGIGIAQRNARNTTRKKTVEDLQLLAVEYQTNKAASALPIIGCFTPPSTTTVHLTTKATGTAVVGDSVVSKSSVNGMSTATQITACSGAEATTTQVSIYVDSTKICTKLEGFATCFCLNFVESI